MTAVLQSVLPPLAQPTIVGVAAVYFAIVGGIAVWAARRTHTAGDFFLAGRRLGLLPMTLAALAANLSGFAFIGGPGLVYSAGLGGLFLILPAAITGTLSAWVLGKRMRLLAEVRPLMTVPDAIAARYRSRLAQGLAGTAILVAVIGYMATNILALGVVIDAIFGVGPGWGIWLGMGTVLAYSATGGILAGVYTDVFQGTLMAVASALVFFFALDSGGGLEGISRTILSADPAFMAPWGKLTPMAALSFFFVFGMGVLGQPHVIHKYYMLKDPRRLKWYPLLSTLALLVSVLLFFGVGVAMKALVVRGDVAALASPDQATPVFLLRHTPVLLAALVFSGVAAAIMSTVNAFMNVGAAALTHDLPVALGRPVANELRLGRASTVVLSVLAALLAQHSGALIVFLGIFGWGLFASTLVPALAIGLNWEGATRAGAVASIATGLLFTLGFELLAFLGVYAFPAGATVAGASLALSILVFFVVSHMTQNVGADGIDADVRMVMEV